MLRSKTTKGDDIQLEKWYLDLTTPAGEVFIGYWARLRACRMSITWSRWSLSDAGREPTFKTSLSAENPPAEAQSPLLETEGKQISWKHAALGIEGEWLSRFPFYQKELLEQQHGSVQWHCHCPAGEARLRVGERGLAGVGYAESLSVSLPPWRLPIEELHWGRFIGADTSMVWIRWRGPRPLNLVLVNGRPFPVTHIDQDGVATQECVLRLQKVRGLSEAHLGAALRSSIRPFRWIVPKSIFPANEQKWLSAGLLQGHNQHPVEPTPGWAIHEQVRFGRGEEE